jgi:hypothetical protein
MRINANTVGSDYDTGIAVFTGTRGALTFIGCNDDVLTGRNRVSSVTFDGVAGETYYFMVGSCCGTDGGNLVFNVKVGRGQDPLEHTFVFQEQGSFTTFDDCLGEGNLRLRARFHITINANETLTVVRDTFEVVCR